MEGRSRPTCVGIDRASSIDLEPQTLNFRQIQFAREAAMYVLKTKSTEEAFQIFTQGLEPVTSVGRKGDAGDKIELMEDSDGYDGGDDECDDNMANRLCRTMSCRCRDVTTAPF